MENKSIKYTKIAMTIFALAFILLYYLPSLFITMIILFLFLIAIMINSNFGLYIMMLIIPFGSLIQSTITTIYSGNIVLLLTFLIGLKSIFELLLRKEKLIVHGKTIVFAGVFLFLNLLSLLINTSNVSLIPSYYGMLVINMLLLIVFVSKNISSKEFFFSIIYSMLLTSMTIVICLIPEIMDLILGSGTRLRFAGNLRTLTNSVAPSMVIGIYLLSSSKHYVLEYYEKYQSKNTLRLITLSGMVSLLLTGSRGTIYALAISLIVIILLSSRLNIKRILYITVSFIIIVFINSDGFNLPTAIQRLFSYEDDLRIEIWKNAFLQVNELELILGRGMNRFQELSIAGGFVAKYTGQAWYAHSIYVDILFSSGIFSLGWFMVYVIKHFKDSLTNRSRVGLGLVIYLLILFFTHGEVINTNFWLYLSIVAGLNKWFTKDVNIWREVK